MGKANSPFMLRWKYMLHWLLLDIVSIVQYYQYIHCRYRLSQCFKILSLSLTFTARLVGPTLGFLLGSACLGTYVYPGMEVITILIIVISIIILACFSVTSCPLRIYSHIPFLASPLQSWTELVYSCLMFDCSTQVDFNEKDPRWVGAWWIGFPIIAALLLLFSAPLIFFPQVHLLQPCFVLFCNFDICLHSLEIAKNRLRCK